MTEPFVNIVVACCKTPDGLGIGANGTLPWKLPSDVKFFKKLTTTTEDIDKQNVVIMGRKTWDSIPQVFRPLKNRVNIVMSRHTNLKVSSNVYVVNSFEKALKLVSSLQNIEQTYVIGGASIYKLALLLPVYRLYMTQIHDYVSINSIDTFLPYIDFEKLKRVKTPNIPSDVVFDNGIMYNIVVYEKLKLQNEQ